MLRVSRLSKMIEAGGGMIWLESATNKKKYPKWKTERKKKEEEEEEVEAGCVRQVEAGWLLGNVMRRGRKEAKRLAGQLFCFVLFCFFILLPKWRRLGGYFFFFYKKNGVSQERRARWTKFIQSCCLGDASCVKADAFHLGARQSLPCPPSTTRTPRRHLNYYVSCVG